MFKTSEDWGETSLPPLHREGASADYSGRIRTPFLPRSYILVPLNMIKHLTSMDRLFSARAAAARLQVELDVLYRYAQCDVLQGRSGTCGNSPNVISRASSRFEIPPLPRKHGPRRPKWSF
jgi:hypothetical protein